MPKKEKGKILINVNDIIGKCLEKLEVKAYYGYSYSKTRGGERLRHFYWCKCECGRTCVVQRGPLLNNITHSCGCGRRERRKE